MSSEILFTEQLSSENHANYKITFVVLNPLALELDM